MSLVTPCNSSFIINTSVHNTAVLNYIQNFQKLDLLNLIGSIFVLIIDHFITKSVFLFNVLWYLLTWSIFLIPLLVHSMLPSTKSIALIQFILYPFQNRLWYIFSKYFLLCYTNEDCEISILLPLSFPYSPIKEPVSEKSSSEPPYSSKLSLSFNKGSLYCGTVALLAFCVCGGAKVLQWRNFFFKYSRLIPKEWKWGLHG